MRTIIEGERGKHPIYVFTYLCQAKNVRKRNPGQRYPVRPRRLAPDMGLSSEEGEDRGFPLP
jgi:hypothetical protein